MRTQSGATVYLKDYKPSDYLIDSVDLTFALGANETIVTSKLVVSRRDGVSTDAQLVLDGDELEFVSMALDGTSLDASAFEVTPESLTLNAVPAADNFTLEITTRINPVTNKKLMGLYQSSGNYCTQCEAEGFRRITYYLDRPDVLSVFTVRIEATKKDVPLLLSNGNCIDKGVLDDDRHFAVWHDPYPKPAYLFALFAGDLGVLKDSYTTVSGRKVALEIYVEHGKEERATYAMDSLIRSMKWDEEVYGCEYDLDIFMIVAVSDFNMGAMENKGLNIFNDKYVLADPDTATDIDYANIEAIIAHEYFHNWTGNRITCRDWFQLCLKEGLTVYRDHSFSADMRSAPVKRIAEVRGLRAHQFPEDAGPLAHPVRPHQYAEINNFYTSTVYEKGSELIGMLHTIVGAGGYRKAMDLYFERHDGDAATIEQFITCFEDATGKDLTQFARWYDQPGTPNLTVETGYDATAKRFSLAIKQKNKPMVVHEVQPPLHIPVRFGLLGSNGNAIEISDVSGAEIENDVIHLREEKHEIVFENISETPMLSILRGFSAPVTVQPTRDANELAFLAQYDSDPYARWEALNGLLMRQLRQAALNVQNNEAIDVSSATLSIVDSIIDDENLEPAYRALCITLPSEADIAREIGTNIDTDAIYKARETVLDAIAQHSAEKIRTIYDAFETQEAFSPDASAAGNRALRNVALGYVIRNEGPQKAKAHFDNADNMTDRFDALAALCRQFPSSSETGQALVQFKDRYSNDHIVMDKWFAVQAMMPGEGAVDRIEKLTRLDEFSWENPNRVRSVIGSFSVGNATGFNAADGTGYKFICEAVTKLDKINPQVAARLITSMRSWKMLESSRKAHALSALQKLAAIDNLSRDVRDIVERTLA